MCVCVVCVRVCVCACGACACVVCVVCVCEHMGGHVNMFTLHSVRMYWGTSYMAIYHTPVWSLGFNFTWYIATLHDLQKVVGKSTMSLLVSISKHVLSFHCREISIGDDSWYMYAKHVTSNYTVTQ